MKHIKKHPINDKAQKLSKDMKKQELIKPKTDKKLDADKSLSDPDVSMRVSKPSNNKLDGEKFLSEGLKHLKTFESYTFEDFTNSDMEDVKELLEEGLPAEQIAIELNFSLDKIKQIIYSLKKNQEMMGVDHISPSGKVTNMSPEDDDYEINYGKDDYYEIHIPIEYSGVIMELGDVVDPNDIISLYNEIVEEGTPLVSYSEYGTEGKFYNEDDDEIPTDVILDELNYAIGLDGEKEFGE